MPHEPKWAGLNADMPAIWLLNAQIARADEHECSCWSSGCGEFDIFEVLSPGDERCTNGPQAFGSPAWFRRPMSETRVAAVLVDNSAVTIRLFDKGEGEELFREREIIRNLMTDMEDIYLSNREIQSLKENVPVSVWPPEG